MSRLHAENSSVSVEALSFSYSKSSELFSDVTFQLQPGDMLQILGANGSGKSTLMNCIVRQLHPTSGVVRIQGDDISNLTRMELARRVAYVPQIQNNTCSFEVRDYVVMGRAPHLKTLSAPSHVDYEIVDETLELLNIAHLADKHFQQISGGERQQVQIARALVQKSQIILFDEPTNHLDYGNQYRVLSLMVKMVSAGYTVISTTHQPDSPLLTGGYLGMLCDGKFEFGKTDELLTSKSLRRLYNIDAEIIHVDEIGRDACLCLPLADGLPWEGMDEKNVEQKGVRDGKSHSKQA